MRQKKWKNIVFRPHIFILFLFFIPQLLLGQARRFEMPQFIIDGAEKQNVLDDMNFYTSLNHKYNVFIGILLQTIFFLAIWSFNRPAVNYTTGFWWSFFQFLPIIKSESEKQFAENLNATYDVYKMSRYITSFITCEISSPHNIIHIFICFTISSTTETVC